METESTEPVELEVLVETALIKLSSHHAERYDIHSAVDEAIRAYDPEPSFKSKSNLLELLTAQSKLTPEQVGIDGWDVESHEDWIDVANHLIVASVIYDIHPELEKADDRFGWL